ncbi:DUF7504 family protein [Halorussus salinus]|uniref:DUF7504 family protein n=1 Tax=Halorussus salinus TaxID=1364935 RepID=UPI00109242B1|nr:hypothetical protein [Halorussus salinus]
MRNHTEGDTGDKNVLVHVPPLDDKGDAATLGFLTQTPPRETNVLVISYIRSADEWLRTWLDYAGESPAHLGIIRVGETTRSATTASASDSPSHSPSVIETVANPRNLTDLGITISEYISDWDENPYQTCVCFDSLTALLQYTENVQTAFRFLHTVVGRVKTANARACYQITPDAHDDQTVALITGLFDTVLEHKG